MSSETGEPTRGDTAWLGAATAALGALLAFLGYGAKELPWLITNEPTLFLLAASGFIVSFLVLAAAWVIAWRKRDTDRRARYVRVAYVLLGASAILAVATGARGYSAHPEFPHIDEPTFETTANGVRVQATVTAGRLQSNDRLVAFVDQLTWHPETRAFEVSRVRSDSFGPDAEGKVSRTIGAQLEPGTYRYIGLITWLGRKREFDAAEDCYNRGRQHREISCVLLRVERRPEEPQLDVAWRKAPRATLRIDLSTRYTNDRPVTLQVTGVTAREKREPIAAYALEPDVYGSFTRTLEIDVPRRFRAVCVLATISARASACPPRSQREGQARAVWTWLQRPRS